MSVYGQKLNTRLYCKDGFSFSIQASASHYCKPREDNPAPYPYIQYEIGDPTKYEPLLAPYHSKNDGSGIYAWVPVDVINDMIDKHGGLREWV
jgi:hypothetical protein